MMGIARYIRRVVYTVYRVYRYKQKMDLPPNSNEGQICSKFANECMKLPSKATLPIASFSKQQYPARERMTSLSLYLSGNKIIVCCHSNSIVYCVL